MIIATSVADMGIIITLTMMGSYNAGAKRARSAAGGMKISV